MQTLDDYPSMTLSKLNEIKEAVLELNYTTHVPIDGLDPIPTIQDWQVIEMNKISIKL